MRGDHEITIHCRRSRASTSSEHCPDRRNQAPCVRRCQRSVSRTPAKLREGERSQRESRVVKYGGYSKTGHRRRGRRSRHSGQQWHRRADQGRKARGEHSYRPRKIRNLCCGTCGCTCARHQLGRRPETISSCGKIGCLFGGSKRHLYRHDVAEIGYLRRGQG